MEEELAVRKRRGLGSIFPPKNDFEGMLLSQAEKNLEGVRELSEWLRKNDLSVPPTDLQRIEQEADDLRHKMEVLLMDAFSTPFDRENIYAISRQMDYILNFSLSTAIEMRAFEVKADDAILGMAANLQNGVEMVRDAIKVMHKDPVKADHMIRQMRKWEREIEVLYVSSLAAAFKSDDHIEILKRREVYHHLKDAGRALSITIDILHRIIVELA
jgi:uncharacterized protein Yka (UPF0111/DUF47 family)